MKISPKGRYTVRIMIDLAKNSNGKCISLNDLSSREEIPLKYAQQLLSLLCARGLLKSIRGPYGGYILTKLPSEYTIGEILRVTEGAFSPISCLDENQQMCHRAEKCNALTFWIDFFNVINRYLDSVTLDDLISENSESHSYSF